MILLVVAEDDGPETRTPARPPPAKRGAPPAPDEKDAPDAPDALPDETPEERVERARRLLAEAIAKERKDVGGQAPVVGQRVDKYFGTKLPPVCAQLGCYVTDDGKRFYCVNPSCQKHKKRETKHTRRGRPDRPHFVYFRCPRCSSRSVEMHLLTNTYACRACMHQWER